MRPDSTPAEATVSAQMADEVSVALAQLSDPDRAILSLRYMEQMSVAQVAQRLGVSEPAAQKRIGRAMTRLREKLSVSEEVLGASALGVLLLSRNATVVPAHLFSHVTSAVAATGGGAASATSAGILAKGVMKSLFWSSLKIPLAIGTVAATLAVGAYVIDQNLRPSNPTSVASSVPAGNPGAIERPRPAPSNISGAEYPRIDGSRRATFRFFAPQAVSVTADLGDKYDMIKDAEGYWTVTTEPLSPGFHYYQFNVDGVAQPDPASRAFFGVSKMMSGLEVPAPETAFCTPQNVPHGEIRAITYDSATTASVRQVFVYTPPGYEAHLDRRFPVVYLLPGAGEDQRAWVEQGSLGAILDNLIAAGKAPEMIVVSEEAGTSAGFSARARGNVGRGDGARGATRQNFPQILISETIPAIDRTFRTIPDREHRALAGSAGGATQSLQITQDNLGMFAYVGAFGAQPTYPAVPEGFGGLFGDPSGFARQIRLLYIGAATNENNAVARMFHQELEDARIPHVYTESPGTFGGWQTWRSGLRDFASLVFKDARP